MYIPSSVKGRELVRELEDTKNRYVSRMGEDADPNVVRDMESRIASASQREDVKACQKVAELYV